MQQVLPDLIIKHGDMFSEKLFIDNYIIGAISGLIGAIIVHPVDTLKSNVQSNILSKLSIKDLYKGLTPAITSNVIEYTAIIGVYKEIKKYTDNNFIAGGLSGLASSIPVTILERIKIMKQINITNINPYEPSSSTIKKSIKPNYISGLTITMTREVPGFAIYFSVYEYLKKNRDITFYNNFINGAVAGSVSWLFIYPQDRIKTNIQGSNSKNKIRDIFRTIYRDGGIRSFYKGFHLCLIRACLLHGTVLTTMEYVNSLKIIHDKN